MFIAREPNRKLLPFMVEGVDELIGVIGSLDCITAAIFDGLHYLLGYDASVRVQDLLF